MYQAVSEYPPPLPLVDRDRFVAVCQQIYHLVDAFVPFSRSEILESIPIYNFKELLTCHPRVDLARIGQYHERDF